MTTNEIDKILMAQKDVCCWCGSESVDRNSGICNSCGDFNEECFEDFDEDNTYLGDSWSLCETAAVNIPSRQLNSKLNQVRGDLTEYAARKRYENDGYFVVKLVIRINKKHVLNKEEIKDACTRFGKKKLCKFIEKKEIRGLPDFLCIDQHEAFFVECKARLNGIKEHQQINFGDFSHLGYKVMLYCLPVTLDFKQINFGKSEIYALSIS